MMQFNASQVSEQLVALEQQVGRIMIRSTFGKSWHDMTPLEQVQVIAYCKRVVGEPRSLSFSALHGLVLV